MLVATPVLADPHKKDRTYRVEIPVQIRTEIYLRESKLKTAIEADRITGKDTYTKRFIQRESIKPKRYVPRYVRVKIKK